MPKTPVVRILDASLNRGSEGLRVVEDFVRFVLDDPFLTGQVKALRHEFRAAGEAIPTADRHAARDTQCDVGAEISHAGEWQRDDSWDVCAASLNRVAQSLRSLEEYGKLIDGCMAEKFEALRYQLYIVEKAIAITRTSREQLEGVRLCVLVDGRQSAEAFEHLVGAMIEAGVNMIQLRAKKLDDRELIARARLLVELTKKPSPSPSLTGRGTLAIINDRPDIAAAVHADGVHLGQEDLAVKDVRAIVGTRMLIGVSTHNIDQARTAVLDGANYLGAGPTFPSHTKSFEAFAGLDYLRAVAAETRLPTFAIGGITAQNLRDVLSSGIARVAVGAAVTQADNPPVAIRELLAILNQV